MKTETLMDLDIDVIDRQVLSPNAMKESKLAALSARIMPQGRPMDILAKTRSMDEILAKAPRLYK
jgi:hypothetical protein